MVKKGDNQNIKTTGTSMRLLLMRMVIESMKNRRQEKLSENIK